MLAGSPLSRAQSEPTANPAPAASPADANLQALRDAYQLQVDNKLDDAIAKISGVIKADPKNLTAYVLRASVYVQKKQWDLAEQDFQAAAQVDPNNLTVKFNLANIKFVQKQYDMARPGFVELANDPDVGDLAAFKIFLCDLFGAHDDAAAKELAAFNDVGSKPSYYFANAAWALFHKKTEDARGWLASAANIYAPQKNSLYASSLVDLGYLPLPPPPAGQ